MRVARRRCRHSPSPPAASTRATTTSATRPKQFELGRPPTRRRDRGRRHRRLAERRGAARGKRDRRAGRGGIRGELRGVSWRERRGKAAVPATPRRPQGQLRLREDSKIPRTIGNYWPYATTLFDYVRRAMPLTAPGSLTRRPDVRRHRVPSEPRRRDPGGDQLDARRSPRSRCRPRRASSTTTAADRRAEKTSDNSACHPQARVTRIAEMRVTLCRSGFSDVEMRTNFPLCQRESQTPSIRDPFVGRSSPERARRRASSRSHSPMMRSSSVAAALAVLPAKDDSPRVIRHFTSIFLVSRAGELWRVYDTDAPDGADRQMPSPGSRLPHRLFVASRPKNRCASTHSASASRAISIPTCCRAVGREHIPLGHRQSIDGIDGFNAEPQSLAETQRTTRTRNRKALLMLSPRPPRALCVSASSCSVSVVP